MGEVSEIFPLGIKFKVAPKKKNQHKKNQNTKLRNEDQLCFKVIFSKIIRKRVPCCDILKPEDRIYFKIGPFFI